jgi:hypothetical protein
MNLFSASWRLNKAEIEMEKRNFYAAISRKNKTEVLQCYQNIQRTFEEIPVSVANFFQKWKVERYKKKTLAELQSVMDKKRWLNK